MAKRPKRPRDPMQLAKLIGDIAVGDVQEAPCPPETPATAARRKGGLRGGKARAKKLPPKKRRAIARKAAAARWSRNPRP
jgi:hypothetical protein